ncbi:MAG: helix-hairpin-helix domain-containing protein [Hungatella sp.]
MKKQWLKTMLIFVCMLAAGICYSCSRSTAAGLLTEQEIVMETEAVAMPEAETSLAAAPVCYYVHICGEVVSPGVYEMEAGSRVFQVVERAGGFTGEAAKGYLNLAEMIRDGMKIAVPSVTELEKNAVYGESAGDEAKKVNLNTATKEELMTLKGVGEAKAEDILRYREDHGGFQSIEEIMEISGIKDAAFQKIKDDIIV